MKWFASPKSTGVIHNIIQKELYKSKLVKCTILIKIWAHLFCSTGESYKVPWGKNYDS